MMSENRVGWDIGGAHLKAALLNQQGEVLAVYQESCPLWQGLDTLEDAFAKILLKFPRQISQHAVTMTGELVDLFADKVQGVQQIIAVIQKILAPQDIAIYAGRLGFIEAAAVTAKQSNDIASANWLASATYVAQQRKQGLFVDMGSTTTDILLFNRAKVDALGYTDYQRLVSGELIYTGMVRTAVMATVQSVHFAGSEVGVMSEYFATMADIYRITLELNEVHDQSDTADGGAKTEQGSMRRLARMIGCNIQDFPESHWRELANTIRHQQLLRIQRACEKHLSRREQTMEIPLIGAGIGRFLLQDIAKTLAIEYIDFNDLFKAPREETVMQIADCAPAVAVAYLVRE